MSDLASERSTLAPQTVIGWARLRARLESDGVLSAADKALLMAAVAAVRGRGALLVRELARLEQLGGSGGVPTCASVLALCRGREVADAFAAAAGIELDWSAAASEPVGSDELAEARDYLTPASAAPAPPVALLAEHAPDVLVGYRGLRGGIFEEGSLEPQLVELALFAISAADFQQAHAAVHGTKAIEAGAGTAELVEAGLCAIPSAGMGSWLYAAAVIDELLEKGQK